MIIAALNRVLPLVVVASLLIGCATPRPEASPRTDSTLGQLRGLLNDGVKQSGAFQSAVEKLAGSTAGDLREAYDRFVGEALALRTLADDVNRLGGAVDGQARDYLANWESELAQIGNSDLKKMGRERQILLREEYDHISSAMAALGLAYSACENNLADLEKFLGNDLTRAGSEMAGPHLQRLTAEAEAMGTAYRKAAAAVAHLESVF